MIKAISNFDKHIDMLVSAGDYAVMLQAYMDASEKPSGVFCVAGLAFGPDRAKKAAREWAGLWGQTSCHMTDLHSRAKGSAFAEWDNERAGEMLKKSIAIMTGKASYGVAVSCDIQEFEKLAPKSATQDSVKYLGAFRRPYGACMHLAMSYFGHVVSAARSKARIAYFLERGDAHQSEAISFINLAVEEPKIIDLYSYISHTVIAKADCRLLESADILAWEWATQRDRQKRSMHIRPSIKAILDYGAGEHNEVSFLSEKFRCVHLTGEPLERYFEKVKRVVLS